MARKVNPISVRLNSNYHSDSSWFSDHCYGKLLYQDVDFRYFFRSIFPRIFSKGEKNKTKEEREKTKGKRRKTFGTNRKVDLRLGRCIIHHFPKRTFIHVFFFLVQRRPPLFFGRRHRRRRQPRLTNRRAIGKGIKKRGLLNYEKASETENSHRALITPLVVQYFYRMKNQIHSDPTTVNIIDDNFLFLSPSLLSFSYGKDAARRSDKMRNAWGRFAKRKLCRYIGNALCKKAKNLCYQSKSNRDARCECTKPRKKDICNSYSYSYSSLGKDARRRLYIANARFGETKKVCSYCCWKKIKPWWPEMQILLSSETSTNILIKPVRADFFYQSASLIAQEILWRLEKKKSFVQICTSIFQQIENCECVKGIRICCSGRLNGAEIAQTECMKYGSTSLHVFSDYIGYARTETFTRYGILGVKVWISYSKYVLKNEERSDAVSKTYKVSEMPKRQM